MSGIKLATIAQSIAALSISGVTVKGLTGIPALVTVRDVPILFPNPENFVSNMSVSFETKGSNSYSQNPRIDVKYTLNYVFLHSPIGADRNLFDGYSGMIDKIVSVCNAIINNDAMTGAVDAQLSGPANIGQINDPSGNPFFGCNLAISILEYYEL